MSLIKRDNQSIYPIPSNEVTPRVETALQSIQEMEPCITAFNRSNSDFTLNLITIDHYSDTRDLRQISAEIKRKRDALTECHFAYEKNKLEAEIFQKNADNMEDGPERDLELLKANEQRAYAQMKHEAVIGATKDVAVLRATYDKVMAKIIEKHGKFDEGVFEKEEKEYWIKKSYAGCLQDLRESGRISKSEQLLTDHIGIDAQEVKSDCMHFMKWVDEQIASGKSIMDNCKADFLEQMAQKHISKIESKLSEKGHTTDHLYIIPEETT